ncbi:FAD-binding protein [Chryseobacterium carnipullorum]|uniref:FAD-binding protein n=1 Tax=Chryseobacterium carnipullorum TaxID=1124835 RepID=A0A376DRS4_CHRCU|nr:NAD(P)/FAD-dependent oxidoreductase [Chryseobacterium carnipullorum]AZA49467.1 FAD-binding protein [Chryseobacterium carnipullorum]AZA64360.1 FAD-binding protein [Chryseobacterium carnipullorum]STC94406.1 ribulose-1,5-biphosphate synthetase [Chryseobacterium carnipullorum]
MQKNIEITLLPHEVEQTELINQKLAEALKLSESRIKGFEILKRSIDARSRKVIFRLQVKVFVDEEAVPEFYTVNYPNVGTAKPVIIIGAGPAGLFAALQCIENGLKPIIIERGKDVKQRRRDLAAINKQGLVNTESNYCYGEGGAGTYSDGKLYTRSNKRGDINKVLQVFVNHGAQPDITIDARPHIGTNKLPHIITSIKNTILNAGGEVMFNSQMTDILIEFGKVKGIEVNFQDKLFADDIILATGHSARDVYELLNKKNILIEAKPFALGVRIEHPQETIDKAQYHCDIRSEFLPPANYSLVEQVGTRGVFSFCMCPGGIIAPCATGENEIVVNGWSPSKRNNPYANSGTVVQVTLEDVQGYDPLRMLHFQSEIEKRAFEAGGGNLVAPAQRMVDFVNNRLSIDLPRNSYLPGTKSSMLDNILPDFVSDSLRAALPLFGKKIRGYYTNEAILVGVESRTSSPVRIPRDKETYQHPQVKGLYPCAEGAGYAGGILSAAIDGINCANAILSAS